MILRIQIFFKNYWPSLLAGILMGTSYIPFPPWAIGFCFAPLWFQVLRRSPNLRAALWSGWSTQFLLSLIGFYWIAFVSHEYGYFPWPLSFVFLFLFAAGVHTYFVLAAGVTWLCRFRLQLSEAKSLFAGVAILSLSELWWPSLFPWNLGYTLLATRSSLSAVAQWSDVIGFWGLSLLLHTLSALVAYLCMNPKSRLARLSLGAGIAVFALLWLTGNSHGESWKKTDKSLQVLQIQANIGNLEKYYAERGAGFEASIADQYFQLTRQGLEAFPQTELIVWPESAYPDYLDTWNQGRRYSRSFFDFAKGIQKPILTGAYSSDSPGTIPHDDYNGLFLFDEKAQQVGPAYHKTFLLAYGEYTPGARFFPWMAKLSPAGIGFGRGPGPTVVPFREAILGLQICYESLYPSFTEALVKKGADLLVNLTNDSWFGPTSEPLQHLYMTLGRGLEARRPLIRSTNTGVSTVILASGEILELSPLFQPWYGIYDVKFTHEAPLTFYVKYGAILPWALFAMLFLVILTGALKGRAIEKSERPGLGGNS